MEDNHNSATPLPELANVAGLPLKSVEEREQVSLYSSWVMAYRLTKPAYETDRNRSDRQPIVLAYRSSCSPWKVVFLNYLYSLDKVHERSLKKSFHLHAENSGSLVGGSGKHSKTSVNKQKNDIFRKSDLQQKQKMASNACVYTHAQKPPIPPWR